MTENITESSGSEIELKCVLCQEEVQLTNRDAEWFAYSIDERGSDIKDYLVTASAVIKGKNGKCTESEDGRHLWIFHDRTNKKFDDISSSILNEDQKLSALENKKKQTVDHIAKLEEEKRNIEKNLDSTNIELTNIGIDITKGVQVIQEIDGKIVELMRIKNVDNFKKIWIKQ